MSMSAELIFSRIGTGQWEFEPYTKTIHRSSYPAISPTNPANSASDKVILITGGGSGVGFGIAESFVKASAKAVIILGRRESVLSQAKSQLEKAGSSLIHYFQADVTDAEGLQKAFQRAEQAAGKIDVVVANAATVLIQRQAK